MTCLFQTTPLSSDMCRDAAAPPTPPPKPMLGAVNDAWASLSNYDLTGKLHKAHAQFQAIEWTTSLVFGVVFIGAIFALMMFALFQTMRSGTGHPHDLLIYKRTKKVRPSVVYKPQNTPTRRYALGLLDFIVLGWTMAYQGGLIVVAKLSSGFRYGSRVVRHGLAVAMTGLATRLEPKTTD